MIVRLLIAAYLNILKAPARRGLHGKQRVRERERKISPSTLTHTSPKLLLRLPRRQFYYLLRQLEEDLVAHHPRSKL